MIAHADSRTGPQSLVGRRLETKLVEAFLADSAQRGAALVLVGEPGVGKTAILEATSRTAEQAGIRVVHTAGLEFLTDAAYASLGRALHPLRSFVAALSHREGEALRVALGWSEGQRPERISVAGAALALLRHASADRPLLMVVDDLQWLDRASSEVLGMIIRRLAGTRIGLLCARRPEPGVHAERSGAPEHWLDPLDSADSERLLRRYGPDLDSDLSQRILHLAQGNPLALLELPKALNTVGRSADEPQGVVPLTRRLLDLYTTQIAALPPAGRSALLTVALDESHGAAGHRDVSGLEAAGHAGLIRLDRPTGRWIFRHPLVRSAVVQLATPEERRQAHAALAVALAAAPEPHAWHLGQATLTPEEPVARLLEDAAQRMLRRGDAVGAISALSRSAELSPRPVDRSRRIAAAAYVGADVTGRLESVAQLLGDARRSVGGSESLEQAVAAAFLLLNGDGDIATSHRLLVAAIEAYLSDGGGGGELLFEALHTLLMICWFSGGPELWEPFYDALARVGPVPETLLLCVETFADPAHRAHGALSRLDAAISSLHGEHDPTRIVRVGMASVYVGRLAGARPAFWRVIRNGRNGGAVGSAINVLFTMGADCVFTGEWEQAEALIQEGLELCRRHGFELLRWPGVYGLALLAAARGRYQEALALAEDLEEWALPRGARAVQYYAQHVRGLVASSRGDYEEAFRQAEAINAAGDFPAHLPHALWLAHDLVEAAVRTGRAEQAVAHCAAMRRIDFGAISPRLAMLQLASEAAVEPDPEAADALYGRALRVRGNDRWSFDLARIHLARGERLRREAGPERAITALLTAFDVFQRLGATPWQVRTRSELRACGHRFATAASEPEPVDQSGQSAEEPGSAHHAAGGPAPFNSRELEIAHLAAAGLANRQIAERLHISPRTVGNYLYRIFPKLGISSRAGLRDALERLAVSFPVPE